MRVPTSRPVMLGALLVAGAAASGCNPDPVECPVGCQILLRPDSVTVGSSPDFWTIDNIGMAMFVDALVQDEDGLPMNNVKVYVQAAPRGIGVLPRTAVETVNPADLPDNWDSIKNEECLDESGQLVFENELCAYYYDQSTGTYYDLSGGVRDGYADTAVPDGGFLPDYLEGVTDDAGILRTWVYIDALPTEQSGEDVNQGGTQLIYSVRVDAVNLTIDSSN